ncbi:MAG: tetratricopeptide repeat protein [Deltaproteobacteria bacterium]|nr:tetratricopeptide repeat protein [Deltaproteobacteria bacterium]
MRYRPGFVACLAGLALALGGCGARAARPTAPTPVASTGPDPATDLSHAPHDAGGGGVPARHPGTGAVEDLGTIRFDVVGRTGSGDPDVVAVVPAQILADGNQLLTDGKQEAALAQFRRLVAEFSDSKLAPVAMFNIALVYEHRGEIEQAITEYRDLVKAYPTGRDSLDAHLRAAALVADRADWPRAVTILDEILARTDLTHADQIEALARKGYVQLERGDLPAAEETLTSAVAVWKRATRIADPYFIAMAHYYLGELAHRRFLAVQLHLPDEQLKRDIQAKEALAVAAYDRWKEALEGLVGPRAVPAGGRPARQGRLPRRGPRAGPPRSRQGARGPPDERRPGRCVRRRHDVERGLEEARDRDRAGHPARGDLARDPAGRELSAGRGPRLAGRTAAKSLGQGIPAAATARTSSAAISGRMQPPRRSALFAVDFAKAVAYTHSPVAQGARGRDKSHVISLA